MPSTCRERAKQDGEHAIALVDKDHDHVGDRSLVKRGLVKRDPVKRGLDLCQIHSRTLPNALIFLEGWYSATQLPSSSHDVLETLVGILDVHEQDRSDED